MRFPWSGFMQVTAMSPRKSGQDFQALKRGCLRVGSSGRVKSGAVSHARRELRDSAGVSRGGGCGAAACRNLRANVRGVTIPQSVRWRRESLNHRLWE